MMLFIEISGLVAVIILAAFDAACGKTTDGRED